MPTDMIPRPTGSVGPYAIDTAGRGLAEALAQMKVDRLSFATVLNFAVWRLNSVASPQA
jgi:hypothetical protein